MTNAKPNESATHLITFRADAEFASADLAIQHADASGRGEPILLGGRYYVVAKPECERLERAGAPFAYLHVVEHPDHPEGLVVTVPVND